MGKKNRAVFLDRDGVLDQAIVRDRKPYPPNSVAEVIIPSGVKTALDALCAAHFLLIGITNQPDVARGTQRKEVVEAINQYLMDQLPLTEIYVCYHDNSDHCDCRKPKPGLIFKAAEKYQVDLTNSFMVGDRRKDIEAGQHAGCQTVFIDFGYNDNLSSVQETKQVFSLTEASSWILER